VSAPQCPAWAERPESRHWSCAVTTRGPQPQPSQEGLEERPPGAREAAQACSPAAKTLPGPGAKVHCEARPEVPPTVPGSRVPKPRPALPQARRAHPGSGTPQCAQPGPPPHSAQRPTRDARSSTLRARGLRWAAGRGGDHPPDGIASSHHALTCATHSTGVAGRPGRESPRAGPRAHQCARAAPSSTAGGGGAVGAVGGRARRYPRAPGSLPAAVPRGRSCTPRWPRAGEDLRGIPWPDAGFSVGRPFCQDLSHAPSSEGLRAFATCFGQDSAPGPGRDGTAGTPVRKGVPSPGGLKPSVWMRAPSQPEDAPRLFGNVGEGAASLETRCY
ncbi:hypothetical protein EI555_017826, partial [Monodon monoceros]